MKKQNHLERIKTYTIDEYVSHMLEIRIKNPKSISEDRRRSYKVFFPTIYTIPKCNICGLEAKFVAHEIQPRSPNQESYHIYGLDEQNEEILFTIDHIVAQGEGGSRRSLANLQVLCYQCNENKSKEESFRCNWKRDLNRKINKK